MNLGRIKRPSNNKKDLYQNPITTGSAGNGATGKTRASGSLQDESPKKKQKICRVYRYPEGDV
jgi:hypothetical protein